jgi:hypothetical protein
VGGSSKDRQKQVVRSDNQETRGARSPERENKNSKLTLSYRKLQQLSLQKRPADIDPNT